jgi:hypothetical protein
MAITVILNLKQLNESIEYVHFKKERLCTALRLIKPGYYINILVYQMDFQVLQGFLQNF